MPAFADCKWCFGNGCNQCHIERKKAEAVIQEQIDNPQPIFSAKLNNPHDMQLMKTYFGKDALEKAFSPGGDGAKEMELNGAIASLLQTLHTENPEPNEEPKKIE